MAKVPTSSTKQLRCPNCQHTFPRPDEAVRGAKIRCPKCGQGIRLGKPDPYLGRVVGGYTLTRRLGGGSMGVVYEASKDGREVAVKLLSDHATADAELAARFRREAKLSMALRHPHIVYSVETGEHQGTPFLAMELVRGVALSKVVDKSGAMNWRKAAELILQIGRALEFLAGKGVIHRDVKPENILVAADKTAKLVDMGFAKVVGDNKELAGGEMELTMAGTALGSPAYMAPEQVMDAASADFRTDLYCLGATMYHLVTGRLPYDGKSAMEVMEKVIREPPVAPADLVADLPSSVDCLIRWTMAKDETRRPQDATAFCTELEAVLAAPDDDRRLRKLLGEAGGGVPLWLIAVGVLVLGVVVGILGWLAVAG